VVRLLTFTTLFPDSERPNHGIFVENRLRHLVATGAATSTVLAPVPFFPFGAARFGAWGASPGAAARAAARPGHPPSRYPVIPKLGMSLAPLCSIGEPAGAGRLVAAGLAFDVIDAHYVYPDGVAAVWLGRTSENPW